METIVLENGFEDEIPKSLLDYMKYKNISWKHYNMEERFWPENKKQTLEYFSSLPEGQKFLCYTVFDGFQQLELVIELFHHLRHKKFSFGIMNPSLPEELIKFYDEKESSITPKELEIALDKAKGDANVIKAFNKIYEFKERMNKKFLEVLEAHEIYQVRRMLSQSEVHFKNLNDIKKAVIS